MLDNFQQGIRSLIMLEAQQDLVTIERAISGENGLGHKSQIRVVEDGG